MTQELNTSFQKSKALVKNSLIVLAQTKRFFFGTVFIVILRCFFNANRIAQEYSVVEGVRIVCMFQ